MWLRNGLVVLGVAIVGTLVIAKMCFLSSGQHPTDEQLYFVPGGKLQGTMLSIHNVVTVVMDMFQFRLKIIT